ncbi:sugar ABC transporter substrate-binding protein [Nesterenkonia alba]|uniref:sugar ABC transporter substrate-binding protein n=1 Tax=Nesterenkonia alba TaxID=515814 RepID=UPI0003B4CA80|nr:sugar ABC transporter substrate-binding protein [Nesterenkonia alba]
MSPNARTALATSAAALLLITACGDGGGDGEVPEDGYSIAFLAASSQNGYNQAFYEGMQNAAEESDIDIDVSILDGQFDANTQLSQLENAATGNEYDGIVVVPQDGPSLAGAFPLANDIPVVTGLNPIGPDIDEMEPQVDEVVSTVAVPPSDAARRQAEDVVEYCEDLDPCEVVLMVGLLDSPLDIARRDAYTEVLDEHDHIEIVATVEGAYDRDQGMSAMQNVLQANPDFDVLLSNADQHSLGATVAIEEAGIDPADVYITGGGGTTEAVANVQEGTWKAAYINFPVSMGEVALEQVINALQGDEVETYINADEVGEIDPYATEDTIDPDFEAEWDG